MNKKLINILVLFLIIIAGHEAQAQRLSSSNISKTGTTVAQFLKIGVSPRAIAMGGAYVAVSDDISAIYTNPAGLAIAPGYQVMFTHTDWIAGTNYDFGAVSLNFQNMGNLGLMISSFNSGEMLVRTIESPDGTGEKFSTSDFMVGLAYSKSLTTNFSIGLTGKYIHQQLWHMSASTFALDVGLLFTTPFWGVTLGASIKNFGSTMQLQGQDSKFATDPDKRNGGNVNIINAEYEMLQYRLPLSFQVGLSKDLNFSETNRLVFAVDAVTPNDNYESVNAGVEYGWDRTLFLRAGYRALFQEDTEEGLTAGFGLNFRLSGTTKFQIDYAYADMGRLDKIDRFSLGVTF